jgi:hypothetical protein
MTVVGGGAFRLPVAGSVYAPLPEDDIDATNAIDAIDALHFTLYASRFTLYTLRIYALRLTPYGNINGR